MILPSKFNSEWYTYFVYNRVFRPKKIELLSNGKRKTGGTIVINAELYIIVLRNEGFLKYKMKIKPILYKFEKNLS